MAITMAMVKLEMVMETTNMALVLFIYGMIVAMVANMVILLVLMFRYNDFDVWV